MIPNISEVNHLTIQVFSKVVLLFLTIKTQENYCPTFCIFGQSHAASLVEVVNFGVHLCRKFIQRPLLFCVRFTQGI